MTCNLVEAKHLGCYRLPRSGSRDKGPINRWCKSTNNLVSGGQLISYCWFYRFFLFYWYDFGAINSTSSATVVPFSSGFKSVWNFA